MMFCFNCGKELPNEAKFCAYCGTNLSQLTGSNLQDETEVNDVPNQEENIMQVQEAALVEAREQYKLGVGAFERGQYKKAQTYFKNALNGGIHEAVFILAETYYRDKEFNWFDSENEVNYVDENGENSCMFLRKEEYVLYYLLLSAISGNKRAISELCGWVIAETGEISIVNLHNYGLLNDFKDGFVIGGSKFRVEQIEFINIYGEKRTKKIVKGLEDWAYANLFESAQAGDGVAQYYIGAYYAKKYDSSCSDEHKSKAKYWIGQAEGKVNAPHIYKLKKYLDKFMSLSDSSEIDFFV